mmetsp:Transcript_42265/g.101733  ORF Transcript_42265/g.101733 Transcript_42265/m.101733 type:complete len:830 (-) Transcript_42265:196-2685(-)
MSLHWFEMAGAIHRKIRTTTTMIASSTSSPRRRPSASSIRFPPSWSFRYFVVFVFFFVVCSIDGSLIINKCVAFQTRANTKSMLLSSSPTSKTPPQLPPFLFLTTNTIHHQTSRSSPLQSSTSTSSDDHRRRGLLRWIFRRRGDGRSNSLVSSTTTLAAKKRRGKEQDDADDDEDDDDDDIEGSYKEDLSHLYNQIDDDEITSEDGDDEDEFEDDFEDEDIVVDTELTESIDILPSDEDPIEPKRGFWGRLFGRKSKAKKKKRKSSNPSSRKNTSRRKSGRRGSSTAVTRGSELVVSFPNESIPSPRETRNSSNRRIDSKKKKKPLGTLGSAARILTLIVVIFLYPLVSDEISDRLTMSSRSSSGGGYSMAQRFLDVPTLEMEDDEEVVEESDSLDARGEENSPKSSSSRDDDGARTDGKSSARKDIASPATPATVTVSEPSFVVPPPPSRGNVPLKERRKMALSFVTDVVKEVGPAVVRVDTETYVKDDRRDVHPTQQDSYVQQGQGSGLIFSKDGYILTNSHVVEDATKVTVTLTDGRVYSCEVCGSDDIVDIAVLRITADRGGSPVANLPVASLGDSDELNVGSIVVAVGSPGGLDNTVTMGIVSGLERSSVMVGIPHKKVDYIQTDAAINFGNSGGPLIDVESGRVIGINAAIRAHMEGTSFAIPINKVRTIMHDLSQGQEIHHGWLGLGLATCTPDWARQNNADQANDNNVIPEVHGAIVHRVYPRTPAEQGGLKENDIILQIGNDKVRSAEDARKLIDLAEVGETIPITVIRGQKERILTVKPIDLSSRLKEIQQEKQRQLQQDRIRRQELGKELGPFRSLLR